MSKQIKRKITVNLTSKAKTLPKTRPSVFERLGTKANSTSKEFCHHWAQSGSCPYGKGCKYSSTHTLISPSKQRAAKTQTITKRRHTKDAHKRVHSGEPEDWDQWDPDELEDADPDDLEKRRQELQRELELQMKMENKARKKEKKVKKESSPSSESSSSSTESSSSTDESSSTSSSSGESRRKRIKKTKSKRASSSSSDERTRKHKSKTKKTSKSIVREKSKKITKPAVKVTTKSPSPTRARKKSETPPLKSKQTLTSKKASSETKSPRPLSRSSDRKEKHRTPSPKPKEKEREKEREREKEKEKEREKEREREREKEREREREKEKEREREKEKERERDRAKERIKEREREKDKDYKKKELNKSPKRDNRSIKDNKKRDTPDSTHSRDRKPSPSRSRGVGRGGSSSRRDHKSPTAKDDRRNDKRDDRDRSRAKDRTSDKNRKEKLDSRDRDRERERRLAKEREAAREKEREEALARCQERQRERERLKELSKKDDRRGRDRNRREDRGTEKNTGDRSDRAIPISDDRLPSCRKAHSSERDRNDRRDRDRHDRTPDGRNISRKSPDRHDRLDRDGDKDRNYDRNYDRSTDRNYERDRDHDRDYALHPRIRDGDRRLDDKDYGSPFDRTRHEDRRYLELDDHYNENSREDRVPIDGRDYTDDRRTRRDLWDIREDRSDIDRERDLDHRSRYGREDSRPPTGIKGREWDPEYSEHEWDRNRRPIEWESRENWDNLDHKHTTEEEWRHYNRSLDGWSNEDRRRWPLEWRERSRPRSSTSHHNVEVTNDDSNIDSRRKETSRLEAADIKSSPSEEVKTEAQPNAKRPAEESTENTPETKKLCIKQEVAPVLEDDLSEISDDADDILNRVEEVVEALAEEPSQPDTTDTTSLKDQNTSTASQKSQSPARSPNRTLQKEESIEDNMDLDFEEISEDELEEESKIKGIGDALGVDWASLVAEFRPRTKPSSSAKLRWESHNVLVNLGISVRFAGEDLVKEVLQEHAEAKIKERLEQKEKKEAVNIKTEVVEVSVNGIKKEIKEEPQEFDEADAHVKEEMQIDPDDVVITHPIAAIQVANRTKQANRRALFSNVGPHRRALAARRDLTIRRHLCNLPINDTYVEAPKRHDPELLKIATQLFERCL